MKSKVFSKIFWGSLALFLILAPLLMTQQAAQASSEDAPLFYDELSKLGQWVNLEPYGDVWFPTGVEEGWKPYVNGRWTPSEQGLVFESEEPFAWAAYHYGNWVITDEYGWVWCPGRTWYPNTCTFRTSDKYAGWAPIPPPEVTPATSIYTPGEDAPIAPVPVGPGESAAPPKLPAQAIPNRRPSLLNLPWTTCRLKMCQP